MKPLRICDCGLEAYSKKDLELFELSKASRYGRRNRCKECKSILQNTLNSSTERKVKLREYNNLRRYGITPDDYALMYINQNGKCAICKSHHDVLCIDHCHTSGKVRGLLCHPCNKGLGHFKDNEASLQEALIYIQGNN